MISRSLNSGLTASMALRPIRSLRLGITNAFWCSISRQKYPEAPCQNMEACRAIWGRISGANVSSAGSEDAAVTSAAKMKNSDRTDLILTRRNGKKPDRIANGVAAQLRPTAIVARINEFADYGEDSCRLNTE